MPHIVQIYVNLDYNDHISNIQKDLSINRSR